MFDIRTYRNGIVRIDGTIARDCDTAVLLAARDSIDSTHPAWAVIAQACSDRGYRGVTPSSEQIRDRAHAICIRWGVDPFEANRTTWGAACETARTELRTEAFRAERGES